VTIKDILKLFIPLGFWKLLRACNSVAYQHIQFRETTLSWNEVLRDTAGGYSAQNILCKCRDALLKVKNGEYPYERDSVLFTEKEIFYPLLSSLLYIGLRNHKNLNLIDFGGSLGSSYFQNKDILKQAGVAISWNIIEQGNFVQCGREYFENTELKFFDDVEKIPTYNLTNRVCLLSSVLQYLQAPYAVLDRLAQCDIKYIIIDRTVFLENATEDILAVQSVPAQIYEAQYPVWFLALNKFLEYVKVNYDIIFKWQALDQHKLGSRKTTGLGFLLAKK
jgi:putative methyltransferase (TIGR04325 family)